MLPKLPSHPLAAAAWVSFLGTGHLDAAAYPEQATAVLQGLWAATRHHDPSVRGPLFLSLFLALGGAHLL